MTGLSAGIIESFTYKHCKNIRNVKKSFFDNLSKVLEEFQTLEKKNFIAEICWNKNESSKHSIHKCATCTRMSIKWQGVKMNINNLLPNSTYCYYFKHLQNSSKRYPIIIPSPSIVAGSTERKKNIAISSSSHPISAICG